MINLDDELAEDYLAECREHLDTVEADLMAMEKDAAELDEELINRVFRAVHSVKGGAGFFELVKVRELAHQMEDAMAQMGQGFSAEFLPNAGLGSHYAKRFEKYKKLGRNASE